MPITIDSPKNFHHYPAGLIVVAGNTTDKAKVSGLLFNTQTLKANHPDQVQITNGNFTIFFDNVEPGQYALTVFDSTDTSVAPATCVFGVSAAAMKSRSSAPAKVKPRVGGAPTITTPTSANNPITSLTPATAGACSAAVTSVWVAYTDNNGNPQTQAGTISASTNQFWSGTLNFNGLPCTDESGNPVSYTEYAQDNTGRTSAPNAGLTLDPSLCPQLRASKKKPK